MEEQVSRPLSDKLTPVTVQINDPTGPDFLHVTMGREKTVDKGGFYLNINGTDFGIEFDCVRTIRGFPGTSRFWMARLTGAGWLTLRSFFEAGRFDAQLHRNQERKQRGESRGRLRSGFFFYFGDGRSDEDSDITKTLQADFLKHVRQFRRTKEIEESTTAKTPGTPRPVPGDQENRRSIL